jgi:hypothetical protein
MAQRTSLNRPYGRQHEDDLVKDITELYSETINKFNIVKGVVTVAGNGTITGFFTQNDIGDDLNVSANGGYLVYSKTGGFSVNTTVQVTMGYEIGSDTINYTWGGYRWTDGDVYIWLGVDNTIQVNGNLTNASIVIEELI